MMLEGTARTWLKNLPANSIESWDQLKARFIANFKDTCKQPMSIMDLDAYVQGENESTTHWVHRVSEVLHSLDRINASSAIITLERNCQFKSLKMKLGWLKCHCNDMGTLTAALVKYVDSDNTKDPDSDEEKPEKGKKNAVQRDSITTKEAMGIMVSAKRIIQILWLTPMCRAICSVVRVNCPSVVEV